jgi:hypothetical protein
MADISSDISVPNFGELSTSFQQGLATAAANQSVAQRNYADIPLLAAQAQQARLANQVAAAKMPLILQAIDQQKSDMSGVAPSGSSPVQQSGSARMVGDDGDISADTAADHAFSSFAPVPTAPPIDVIRRAQAAQITGVGSPDLILAQWKAQVDAVNTRRAQAAGNATDNMRTVAIAPDGAALATLDKLDPTAAAALKAHYANDTPAQLDSDVRAFAKEYGAQSFRYAGRGEAKADTAGTFRDPTTGKELPWANPVGLSQKDKADLASKAFTAANEPVTIGDKLPEARWQALGYGSPEAYAIASVQASLAGGFKPGADPVIPPKAPTSGANAPAAPAQPAAPATTAPTGPVSQPRPAQAPNAPAAPVQQDNGLLPGVGLGAFPRTPAINSAGTQQELEVAKKASGATEDKRQAMLGEASTQIENDQTERALINRAQAEAAHIAPSAVGPGSDFYNGLRTVVAAVSKQPPDALVDWGELNKTLMNMGAQNIRAALQGQRITNQEFMTMLSQGNPNTEQPKATIQRILGYLAANNDYDLRFNNTRVAALRTGADPYQVNGTIGKLADRSDYIQRRTGVTPSTAAAAQAAVTVPTASGPNGQKLYLRNGQWVTQ